MEELKRKFWKKLENDKRGENFSNFKKNKIYNGWEFWKVFKLLIINFYNINYINCTILKRMKFIILRHFWNEKKVE